MYTMCDRSNRGGSMIGFFGIAEMIGFVKGLILGPKINDHKCMGGKLSSMSDEFSGFNVERYKK